MSSSPRPPGTLDNSMSAIRPSPTVKGSSSLLQHTAMTPSRLQATAPSGNKPPSQLGRANGSSGAPPRSPAILPSPAAAPPPSVEPIVSLRGFIKVFHFEQLQSETTGTMSLTVDVRVAQEAIEASHSSGRGGTPSHLRILFGAEPLKTAAEPLPAGSAAASIAPHLENTSGSAGHGRGLQLRADIPPSSAAAPHTKLSIQAVVNETVIDAIDFGYFVIRDSAVKSPSSKDTVNPAASPSVATARVPKREREEPSTSGKPTGVERGPAKQHKRISSNIDELAPTPPSSHGSDQLATPPRQAAPSDAAAEEGRGPSPPTPMPDEFTEEQTTMRPKGKRQGSLIRTSQIRFKTRGGQPENAKVQLTLNHDLEAATRGWNTAEYESRRRLVQFWRRQRGSHIQLSFKAITPDEFIEGSNVVSCIFREETDECYITSVDLIGLLESLIGNRFSTEEKNRIRRNLEGFKPETMSKNKPNEDTQAFFSLIMSFGDPRPRNIEKDVKIFRWNNLLHALLKILSKYSYAGPNDALVKPSADEEVSSEDELSERPAKTVKVEANVAADVATARVLRTRASTRNVKPPSQALSSSDSSFAQSPVLVKTEPQSSPAIAPRATQRRPSPSANRGQSSTAGSGKPTARNRSKQPTARRRAESLQGPPPVSLARPGAINRHSLIGVEDTTMEETEVQDFLYNSAEFMGGEGVNDEVATQPPDSPPSFGSTTTELDGIDGRSFHHPVQRQMQRERAEADIMARLQGANIPHDAPPVPAFLSIPHPPPPHLQPRIPPQPMYPQRQHLQVPHPVYGHRSVRSESSLAHALDEGYVRRPAPPAVTPQQALRSSSQFLHQLNYPQSSPPVPMMSQHAYSSSSQMISPPLQASSMQSPQYIKNEPVWGEEDPDPNDYLLRAGDDTDTNMPFGGGTSSAPDPADWSSLSPAASFPYPHSY